VRVQYILCNSEYIKVSEKTPIQTHPTRTQSQQKQHKNTSCPVAINTIHYKVYKAFLAPHREKETHKGGETKGYRGGDCGGQKT